MKKEIISIEYPIQAFANERQKYEAGKTCKSIKSIMKSGEMAGIEFYEIELNDGTFEEIRGSEVICRFRKLS